MNSKEYIQVRNNKRCLRRVGIERISMEESELYGIADLHLRCLTCEVKWHPDIPIKGRLPKGWWWCPTDEEHTKAMARTKFGWKRHAERLKLAAEAAKEDTGPTQGELF